MKFYAEFEFEVRILIPPTHSREKTVLKILRGQKFSKGLQNLVFISVDHHYAWSHVDTVDLPRAESNDFHLGHIPDVEKFLVCETDQTDQSASNNLVQL